MVDLLPLLPNLLVALGIGALIGLQREQSSQRIVAAGSRTLPLVGLLGGLMQAFFPSLLVVAFVAVLVLELVGRGTLRAERSSADRVVWVRPKTRDAPVFGL